MISFERMDESLQGQTDHYSALKKQLGKSIKLSTMKNEQKTKQKTRSYREHIQRGAFITQSYQLLKSNIRHIYDVLQHSIQSNVLITFYSINLTLTY